MTTQKPSPAPNSSTNSVPKVKIPFGEMLKSVPEIFGVRLNEEPSYTVISKQGAFEIRRYDQRLLASVTLPTSSFDDFRSPAFMILANYIFGANRSQQKLMNAAPAATVAEAAAEKMAMTSPVHMNFAEAGGWTMSFVLPAKYSLANAPVPLDERVRLELAPPSITASVRYRGNNSLERIKKNEARLSEWVASQKQILVEGKPSFAQYDAPFVIPVFKQNEIQLPVRLIESAVQS